MPFVAVRDVYRLGAVPEDYRAGWLRAQLSTIARAIWQPISRAVLDDTTVVGSDETLFVNTTGGSLTITFPLADQMQFARITIKKISAGANVITLAATIDGVVNPTIVTSMKAVTVQSDGTSWYIVSGTL